MKTRNVLLTALLTLILIFTSCNSDDNEISVVTTPDAEEAIETKAPSKI